jgi:hypothetical protein
MIIVRFEEVRHEGFNNWIVLISVYSTVRVFYDAQKQDIKYRLGIIKTPKHYLGISGIAQFPMLALAYIA